MIREDINKQATQERFDAFHAWSKGAFKREFDTAVWGHINRSEIEAMRKMIDRHSGEGGIALDAGCGSGRLLGVLKERFTTVVGSDFSSGLLLKARESGSTCGALTQSDVETLPFKDYTFDMVISVRVIQHMKPEQQQRAISEMARVLKKGGIMILMTYNAYTLLGYYKFINMSGLYRVWPHWPLRDWKWIVDEYSTPGGLRSMFTEASLRPIAAAGAVWGEPELLKFLKISHIVEKAVKPVLEAWFSFCRLADKAFNDVWPVNNLAGRVLIVGRKI